MAISIPFVRNKDVAVGELKQLLSRSGMVAFAEDTLEHAVRLHVAHKDTSFALILYFSAKTGRSSKIVLEKETVEIADTVRGILEEPWSPGASAPAPSNPLLLALKGKDRMGIDESGKGDYFGPLTIAGVCVTEKDEDKLVRAGVKDSKLVSDKQARVIAGKIKSSLREKQYDIVQINPEKYNELYGRIRNLNRLLAWGHARVIENLLGRNDCTIAVCDQFGDESYIRKALMDKGKSATLVQSHRAEQDVAVAAASILARDAFLKKLADASRAYGVELPKGASQVVDAARKFVAIHGPEELGKVAKLHFKTTAEVLRDL